MPEHKCPGCGDIKTDIPPNTFHYHCACGMFAPVTPPDSPGRAAAIAGVKLLSAETNGAYEAIRAMMPAEMDMEQFVGIVGNLCLSYGIHGKELKIFKAALGEFVELMHEAVERVKN